MIGEKLDLNQLALQREVVNYRDEALKIEQLSLEALDAVKAINAVDTSIYLTPDEFVQHLLKLENAEALASSLVGELKHINDLYLADLLGRRAALTDSLGITKLSDEFTKTSMFYVQIIIVVLFFGFLSLSYLYDLGQNYHFIMGVTGILVFMAFLRRTPSNASTDIQKQIFELDNKIEDFVNCQKYKNKAISEGEVPVEGKD